MILLASFALTASAQDTVSPEPGGLDYTVSWFGNTWPAGGKSEHHVQNNADDVFVYGNRIFTNSPWDEAGSEAGIYSVDGSKVGHCKGTHGWGKFGGFSVTANSRYVYISGLQKGGYKYPVEDYPPSGTCWYVVFRYDHDGNPAPWPNIRDRVSHKFVVSKADMVDTSRISRGLACRDGELFIADPVSNEILVVDASTMERERSFPASAPGEMAVDTAGHVWIVDRDNNVVRRYSVEGKDLQSAITDVELPTDVCVDSENRLLVADNGLHRQQIRVYRAGEPGDKPELVRVFGQPVYRGDQPGRVRDSAFFGITGVSVDSAGNVYTVSNGLAGIRKESTGAGFGLKIRKYDSSLQNLLWVREGLEFVDCGDIDPGDENNAYTRDSRYEIDYSAPPGEGWRHTAWTINPEKYPNDPRLNGYGGCSARMIRIQGKRFMLLRPQMSGWMALFRFESSIAIPAALLQTKGKTAEFPPHNPGGSYLWCDRNADGDFQADEYTAVPGLGGWAFFVDEQGSLWNGTENGKIFRFPLNTVSSGGVPIYADHETRHVPEGYGIEHLERLHYDPAHDRMYLGVFTTDDPKKGWGQVGSEIHRYDNWSEKPQQVWAIDPDTGSDDAQPKSMAIAGDFLFWVTVDTPYVRINRLRDGKRIGTLKYNDVVTICGWVDMTYGLQAHQHANGSYSVIVEDDWKGKNVLFHWHPDNGEN